MVEDTNKSSKRSKKTAPSSTEKAKPTARRTKTSTAKKEKDSVKKTTPKESTNARSANSKSGAQTTIEKEQKAFGISISKRKQEPKTIEGVLESITSQLIKEQRRSRRWGVFFKLATFIFLFSVLLMIVDFGQNSSIGVVGTMETEADKFTAVVEVQGMIAPGEFASSDSVIENLQDAFEHKGSQGIILDINSPGGSPVQSGQIYNEIVRLQQIYPSKPVYAVISDLGASGAYYIAAAANEIYADKSSLVGSIGVISNGFGFTGLMDKLGIERRLIVAGENKAFLDPFSEENEQVTEFWQSVLDKTHEQFINSVLKVRGDKIKDDGKVFTGLIYNGEQALELGLIDHLGDKRYVAREIIGYEELRYFDDEEKAWLELVKRFGASMGSAFSQALTHSVSQSSLH